MLNKWVLLASLFTLLCGAIFMLPRTGYCQEAPRKTSAVADLTGTGKMDKISVAVTQKEPLRFTLTINGTKLAVTPNDFFDGLGDLTVVKLDSTSKTRQVMVVAFAPNDYQSTYFFRWDGKAIRQIGIVPQVAEPPTGNGALYGHVWMGFWQCNQKFAYETRTQTIGYVPQAAYFVGVSTTAKISFPIYREHAAGNTLVANVAPGSKIQLLLFWSGMKRPELSDDGTGWYLIKTQTGLCGWAQFKTFKDKLVSLPYAG